jgi:hypothetical protein
MHLPPPIGRFRWRISILPRMNRLSCDTKNYIKLDTCQTDKLNDLDESELDSPYIAGKWNVRFLRFRRFQGDISKTALSFFRNLENLRISLISILGLNIGDFSKRIIELNLSLHPSRGPRFHYFMLTRGPLSARVPKWPKFRRSLTGRVLAWSSLRTLCFRYPFGFSSCQSETSCRALQGAPPQVQYLVRWAELCKTNIATW